MYGGCTDSTQMVCGEVHRGEMEWLLGAQRMCEGCA